MHEFILGFLSQITQAQSVGALVTIDSLVPLGAIVAGVAVGIIQIYNTTRNRAIDLQADTFEKRLDDCERHRDMERAKHEATRNALTEAMTRISQMMSEIKELKAHDAGPQSH